MTNNKCALCGDKFSAHEPTKFVKAGEICSWCAEHSEEEQKEHQEKEFYSSVEKHEPIHVFEEIYPFLDGLWYEDWGDVDTDGYGNALLIALSLLKLFSVQNTYDFVVLLEKEFWALQEIILEKDGDAKEHYASREALVRILNYASDGMQYTLYSTSTEQRLYDTL